MFPSFSSSVSRNQPKKEKEITGLDGGTGKMRLRRTSLAEGRLPSWRPGERCGIQVWIEVAGMTLQNPAPAQRFDQVSQRKGGAVGLADRNVGVADLRARVGDR